MKKHSSGFVAIANDARSRIIETDVAGVQKMQQAQEDFILVDVREESEWQQGHIPQAIHLSKGVIERDIEKQIPDRERKLVLYCGGGYRSALAADNLQKMGYTQVVSMMGGFSAWQEAQLPIEKDED